MRARKAHPCSQPFQQQWVANSVSARQTRSDVTPYPHTGHRSTCRRVGRWSPFLAASDALVNCFTAPASKVTAYVVTCVSRRLPLATDGVCNWLPRRRTAARRTRTIAKLSITQLAFSTDRDTSHTDDNRRAREPHDRRLRHVRTHEDPRAVDILTEWMRATAPKPEHTTPDNGS